MDHEIERTKQGYYCRTCDWTWTRLPRTHCPGIPRYPDWSEVPDNLKTRTLLRSEGLKPGGSPKGCIYGSTHVYYWLYDVSEAVAVRTVTAAQGEALARGRETRRRKQCTCRSCGELMPTPDYLYEGLCLRCFQEREIRRAETEEAARA